MIHMRVEKRSRKAYKPMAGGLEYCSNGCMSNSRKEGGGGRREATHILWLLGRAVYVCPPCAKAMREAYESALGLEPDGQDGEPQREREAVAA